jgi:hypothetical protein
MNKKLVFAKAYIDDFDPDWLSLQFVIFGYHPKGLPFGLGRKLAILGEGMRWHIMFHEIWVGIALEESEKLIWWGKLQRYLIKTLLLSLKPGVIHTQTVLYQQLLGKLGFNAGYLPLFGNIPIYDNSKIKYGSDCLQIDSKEINFIVFGAIHLGAPIDKFAREASVYSQKKNIPVILTFIGRCGPEQDRWYNIWRSEGLNAKIMGEQTPEKISEVLTNSTMGISATEIEVIEKSGSYAAMREHGLPVLSVAKSWQPRGVPKQPLKPGIIKYNPGNFEACLANNKYIANNNKVSDAAIELTKGLLSAH